MDFFDYYYDKMDFFDFKYTDEKEGYIANSILGKSTQGKEVLYYDGMVFSEDDLKNSDVNVEELILHLLVGRNLYKDTNGEECSLPKTIGIDYRLLTDKMVNSIVLLYENNYIYGIRLLPEEQKLTKEIYNKFKDTGLDNDFCIFANESDVECRFDFRKQSNLVKIEKVKNFNEQIYDFEVNENIHINKELTEEEIKEVVGIINEKKYNNIYFNFYDPGYYEDVLILLKKYGLNSDANIYFLANPLYDIPELYSNLASVVDNNIKIHYNSCNDLNEWYKNRSSELQYYYSDLEASGICDLKEYMDILKLATKVDNHFENKNYSDLEKVAYIYDFFKENYIYDPEYKSVSHKTNAHLHLVSNRDRMICEGFSNVLSCLLRRNKINCFNVGVDDHQYNVLRINDSKYGIDNIALLDITWDIGDKKGINNNFSNFLRPLDSKLYDEESSTLNIASSLFVSEEDYNLYLEKSNPGYVTRHFGYARRMLELMGLSLDKNASDNDVRSAIINSKFGELIPTEKLIEAINFVRKAENKEYEEYYSTLDERVENIYKVPHIKINDILNCQKPSYSQAVSLHVPNKDIHFIKCDSQDKKMFTPSKRKKLETFENYIQRMKEYFKNMFYPNGIHLNSEIVKKDEIEEIDDFEIGKKDEIEEIDDFEIGKKDEIVEIDDFEIGKKDEIEKIKDSEIGKKDEIEEVVSFKVIEEVNDNYINESLENYRSSGYGTNVFGQYYNIWIDEYDSDYKPWDDPIFNPYLNKGKKK